MISAKGLFILAPLLVASVAQAQVKSFSVKNWEADLKASLAAGKTDVTPFFVFEKIEKEYLSRVESSDRKNMLEARKLYAQGKLDEALKKYDLIEKGSDYWLEAVEEKGWAYHQQKNFEKSLAQTKTLLAEPLVQVVGSEPFFLQSLGQLKICDYAGVFSTHQTFKDSQKSRVAALESVAKTGKSPALTQVIQKVESFPLTFTQVGVEAKELPRLFYRDLEVQKRLLQLKLTDRGIALIQERLAVAPDAEKTKLARAVELLKKSSTKASEKLSSRLQVLARKEDKETQLMLQKLGLIEVETIQRMHTDKLADLDYSKGKFRKVTSDDLIFPDDGQPWLDELDKYEVSANACPRDVRRKM